MTQRQEAEWIIRAVLEAVRPEKPVRKAVAALPPCGENGRTLLLAIGKAACPMAVAALTTPGFAADQAMIITKYGHADGNALFDLPQADRNRLILREAGHPVPDANSYAAAEEAIAMVSGLTATDRVIVLLSGGGSALFEKPLLPPEELEAINSQLLACGADISEINTIRKRLSAVKGGRFAQLCAPAQVYTSALSDVLSNAPDQIASGPACADPTTCAAAMDIAKRYHLRLSRQAAQLLAQETPKQLPNAAVQIIGGMTFARAAAAKACVQLGYPVRQVWPCLACQAREAGSFFGSLAQQAYRQGRKMAIVAGGETVVRLGKQHGLGGRNQEMALAAAMRLANIQGVSFFSLGTDGTDGPTDAAGGWVDGGTLRRLGRRAAQKALETHDAYHALQTTDGLLFTGPTGTNVNDVCVLLVNPGYRDHRFDKTREKQSKTCIQD